MKRCDCLTDFWCSQSLTLDFLTPNIYLVLFLDIKENTHLCPKDPVFIPDLWLLQSFFYNSPWTLGYGKVANVPFVLTLVLALWPAVSFCTERDLSWSGPKAERTNLSRSTLPRSSVNLYIGKPQGPWSWIHLQICIVSCGAQYCLIATQMAPLFVCPTRQ